MMGPSYMLDFEASSLLPASYPIEIGIARWQPGAPEIVYWSSLIKPKDDWTDWSEETQRIHGITREDLGTAPTAASVVQHLACMSGKILYCDGGRWDFHWLLRLFEDADTPPFVLQHWLSAFVDLPPANVERSLQRQKMNPHRAGKDAAYLHLLLAGAMGERPALREVEQLAELDQQ